MKSIFIFTAVLAAAGGARAEAPRGSVERLAAMVAYVAADYPAAVDGGKVIAEAELAEQKAMLADARKLAATLAPNLDGDLAALERDVSALKPEADIVAHARRIQRRLIDEHGLVLTPVAAPSLERARTLYQSTCAQCHGEDGRADTPRAAELDPKPVGFTVDEARMRRISPQVAFHAITFGVQGTGMAAFDTLSLSDRWSLAFYVVGMRHVVKDVDAGRAAFERAGLELAPTASRLAELSDAELAERLAPLDERARDNALAWLRTKATFMPDPAGTWAVARRLLGQVAEHAGDPARAAELAVAAYLDGVEPHEAMLRTRDRALADRVEAAFLALRQKIAAGAGADEVRREVARVQLVLDGLEERTKQGASGVPFLAAFAIALREGFELSLLIAALLAFVRKTGRGELARYIHLGWLAAIPAGAVTWFAVGAALAGAQRELTEGILTLVAAAMLLFVSHFVLGRLESRRWLKFLERKTTGAARGGGPGGVPWPLLGVAFVAAYREAIEIVLFFKAIVLDAPGRMLHIVAGAAAGVAVLVVINRIFTALGRRMSPRPLMLASSVLLTIIAISLVGQGVRALQTGGYLTITPLPWDYSLRALGVFPTVEGLGVQLVVLALVLVPTWLDKRKARAQTKAA